MSSLFPEESPSPAGFSLLHDYISAADEELLLRGIAQQRLHTFQFHSYAARRRVASFGYDWSFEKRMLRKGAPVPEAFLPIIRKVAAHLSLPPEALGELLLTEYPAGSVINWHRDAPPFDIIAGISLLSDCRFRLRPHDKAIQGKGAMVRLTLPRRSLYVMQGPVRSAWEHSIAAVKSLRYSITFRTLKKDVMLR